MSQGHAFLLALVAGLLPVLTQTVVGEPPSAEPKKAADRTAAARVDILGDLLPAGALARLGTVRFRDITPIAAAVFSRNGKEIISSGQDPILRVWDAATGKELRTIGWNIGLATVVALSPDGKEIVAAGTDNVLRVWDLDSRKEARHWVAEGNLFALTYSKDGKALIGASRDQTARVWDTKTGKELQRFEKQTGLSAAWLSIDGRMAILVGTESVTTFDVSTAKELSRVKLEGRDVHGAMSPDGRRLAGTCSNRPTAKGIAHRSIAIWDVASGKEIGQCKAEPADNLSTLTFSPDGKLLVTSSGNEPVIRVWDAATGELQRQLKGLNGSRVHSLGFFPDGMTLLAGASDLTLRRWNVNTGEALGQLEGHISAVQGLAVSSDGKILATSGTDGTVRLWDWRTGNERRQLIGHEKAATCVAFAGEGTVLASGGLDQTVRLWDSATGKLLRTLPGPKVSFFSVALSSSGEMVAVAGPAPRIWQVETGRERARLEKEVAANTIVFTPDNKELLTFGTDQTVHIWSTNSGKEQRTIAVSGISSTSAVALAPDKKLLAVGDREGTVAVFDFAAGKETRRLQDHNGAIWTMNFAADGKRLVTAGFDQALRVWDAETGKDLVPLPGHHAGVLAMSFREEGRLLTTVGMDRTLRFWDPTTGRERHAIDELPGRQGTILYAAFSFDGGVLVLPDGGSQSLIYVCAAGTGKPLQVIKATASPFLVAVGPAGKHVAANIGNKARIWDATTGEEIGQPSDQNSLLAFSSKGDVLATTTDHHMKIRIWDVSARKAGLTFPDKPMGTFMCLAFSPDGRYLATGGPESTIRVWEIASGKELMRFPGHRHIVSALAFSRDGRLLASGSFDTEVHLFDLRPPSPEKGEKEVMPRIGKELARFVGHRGTVQSLVFSPDGSMLISGSADATSLAWEVPGAAKPAGK